jgi:alkyl sulfatase BDS1-like metallo-beta-lactamase superfamily hydrolase
VNPSLWRQSRLNRIHGLFQVCDRIYQVRGFSLANITFVESDSGVIVIDPLTFTEHARAAWQLYQAERGPRPACPDLHPQPPRPLRRRARHHQPRGGARARSR